MLSVRVIDNSKVKKQKQINEKSCKINNEGCWKCRMEHGTFVDSKSKLNATIQSTPLAPVV